MNQTEQNPSVESILKAIHSLSEKDLLYLLSKLFEQSPMLSPSLNSFVGENKFTDGVVCPYCGKKRVRRNGHKCVQIKGGKSKKGIFHIQHINSYHSVLKKFIENFNGVSTKYLNNYLAWNNFVNYSKRTIQEQKAVLLNFAMTTAKRVTYDMIPARPAVPLLASTDKNQSLRRT